MHAGKTIGAATIREWWARFSETRDVESRSGLIRTYLPLVRETARRLAKRLPVQVEVGDLVSAGTFGLMDAVDTFDPGRGVKFETYCGPRVRGAMLDDLRAQDWVSRLVRRRNRRITEAIETLEVSLGRRPTHGELAARLQVSEADLRRLLAATVVPKQISLSHAIGETESGQPVCEIDHLSDRRVLDPSQSSLRQDLKDLVLRTLTRAERQVVLLYYFEHMTMLEIACTLGISESRVSQMHSSILERLKQRLECRREELTAG